MFNSCFRKHCLCDCVPCWLKYCFMPRTFTSTFTLLLSPEVFPVTAEKFHLRSIEVTLHLWMYACFVICAYTDFVAWFDLKKGLHMNKN